MYTLSVASAQSQKVQSCYQSDALSPLVAQTVPVQYVVQLMHRLFENVTVNEMPFIQIQNGQDKAFLQQQQAFFAPLLKEAQERCRQGGVCVDVFDLLKTDKRFEKAMHLAGSVPRVMEKSFLALELLLLQAVENSVPSAKKTMYAKQLEGTAKSLFGQDNVVLYLNAQNMLDFAQEQLKLEQEEQKLRNALALESQQLKSAQRQLDKFEEEHREILKNKDTILHYHQGIRRDLMDQENALQQQMGERVDRVSVKLLELLRSVFDKEGALESLSRKSAASSALEYVRYALDLNEQRFSEEKARIGEAKEESDKKLKQAEQHVQNLTILMEALEAKQRGIRRILSLFKDDVQQYESTQEALWFAPVVNKKHLLLSFFAPMDMSAKKQAPSGWSALLDDRGIVQKNAPDAPSSSEVFVRGASVRALYAPAKVDHVHALKHQLQEALFLIGASLGAQYPIALVLQTPEGKEYLVDPKKARSWCTLEHGSKSAPLRLEDYREDLGLKPVDVQALRASPVEQKNDWCDHFVQHFGGSVLQKVLSNRSAVKEAAPVNSKARL